MDTGKHFSQIPGGGVHGRHVLIKCLEFGFVKPYPQAALKLRSIATSHMFHSSLVIRNIIQWSMQNLGE